MLFDDRDRDLVEVCLTYALGIDLGTTYSAAAILRDHEVSMLSLGLRTLEVPSVVFLREDGEILVGESAERRGQTDPGRLAREFKRRIGDSVPLLLAGSPYSAQALTARLLRWIFDAVNTREGGPPDRTVVTFPANWGPFKQDLLLQAITLADVPNVRIATEPLAAAVHYASTTRVAPGDIVAVYDLGGGTFDAAVLRKTSEWFDVLGQPEGIEHLGGIDFDEAVFGYVIRALGDRLKLDRNDPAAVAGMARLRRECVEAKETLSADSEVSIPVLLPGVQTEIRLTRGEFEAMIRPAVGETIAALRRTLRSADVEPTDLKAVVLVGGSGRIPLVGELVRAELGAPVAVDTHPKHSVAMGAARLAGVEVPPTPVAKPPAPPAEEAPVSAAPPPEQLDASGAAEWAPPAASPAPAPAPATPASQDAPPQTPRPPPAPAEPSRAAGPASVPLADRESSPSRRGLLVGAGVAAVAVVGIVAVIATRGGDGGNAEPPTTASPSLTTADTTEVATSTSSVASTTIPPIVSIPKTAEPAADDVVLFSSLRNSNWDILSINTDGTGERLLFEGPTDDWIPVWSPDRRSMAFTRGTATGELWVAAADGSDPELISDEMQAATRVAWSPDGTQIAFTSTRGGTPDLWILDLSTRVLRQVTDDAVPEGDPAWSPDGRLLVLWRDVDSNVDLWTIDIEGSGEPVSADAFTRLTTDPGADTDPSWHRGGGRIAFMSERGGNVDVFVIDSDGTAETNLTNNPANDFDPSWSPDGRSLAFASERDAPGNRDVYVMDSNGANQRPVTTSPAFDGLPAWGPYPASG